MKKAWIDASGKQRRSRRLARVFRLNSCCTRKTRVKNFNPPQNDSDEIHAHNRSCCAELESYRVRTANKAWPDTSENERSMKVFRQWLKLCSCCRRETQVKNFIYLQSAVNTEINDDANQISTAPGTQGQCENSESSGSKQGQLQPVSFLSEEKTTKNRSAFGEKTPENNQESKAKDKKQSSKAHLDELYTKGPLLGFGGFGFIYEGLVYEGLRKADGFPVAIKYVSKTHAKEVMDAEGPVPLEVSLMKQINRVPASPHIVQLIEWFTLPTEYAMVLERPYPCQNLMNFCKFQGGSLREDQARGVMLQVTEALRTCQNCGFLFRDFKPSNVLIHTDTLQVKLIDFGSGAFLKETPYEDFAETMSYSPPEWFLQKQYLAGPAVVWSVGVTFFRLVCGSVPFYTEEAVIGVHLYFPNRVSADFCHLVGWCLSLKPEDRPMLEEIVLHPWFH
ncbi:serine/threonine-protein kinase pim-2-like [Arapaima gigas]